MRAAVYGGLLLMLIAGGYWLPQMGAAPDSPDTLQSHGQIQEKQPPERGTGRRDIL